MNQNNFIRRFVEMVETLRCYDPNQDHVYMKMAAEMYDRLKVNDQSLLGEIFKDIQTEYGEKNG